MNSSQDQISVYPPAVEVPASPDASRAPLSHGAGGWSKLLVLLGVAYVAFLRRPDFFYRPQLWAEDGSVLFTDARAHGWSTLFSPYPGYPILTDRIVACFATYFPTVDSPWIYAYAALAILLFSAWYCLRARLDYLMDFRGRAALAFALVLTAQNGETFLVLIGSQWYLSPILCLLILQEQPRTFVAAAIDFLGLVLAGLTGPFILLFGPWFLLRFRKVTGGFSRYNLWFVGVALALAIYQVHALRHGPVPHGLLTRDPHQWATQLACVLPGGLFFGAVLPPLLGRSLWVISPLLLGAFVWTVWQVDSPRRWTLLALTGCAAAIYAGGIQTAASEIVDRLQPFGGNARYFYTPYLFSLWMGVICCYAVKPRLRVAARVALGLMLLASASLFSIGPMADLHWDDYARKVDAGESQEQVPLLPNWHLDIPAK